MQIAPATPDLSLISAQIATQGYVVSPGFLAPGQVDALIGEATALRESGQMYRAGVGKGAETGIQNNLRGDFIHWLDPLDCGPAQRSYLDLMEQLRLAINQTLYLGLFDFECHLAVYQEGSFYRKHLDQFQNDKKRTLTSIVYLNQDWHEDDGGKLRLYLDDSDVAAVIDVPPKGGTLVTFLSSRFWHEVLPVRRERLSITGWFRTRGDEAP